MKRIMFFVMFWIVTLTISFTGYGQEVRPNQKKIDRERAQKARQEQKAYEARKKRHFKMQSKETQKRMRQSKKESRKATPIKP